MADSPPPDLLQRMARLRTLVDLLCSELGLCHDEVLCPLHVKLAAMFLALARRHGGRNGEG